MSALKPDAVNTHDLGTSALPWKNLHIDSVTIGARSTGDEVPTGSEVVIGSDAKLSADPSVPVDVEIYGSLTVHGQTTTISSTTLTISDKEIIVAQGAADSVAASGAGLRVNASSDTLGAADATLLYDDTGTQWEFNKNLEVEGSILPETVGLALFDLGSTAQPWNDLHLSSEGDINFNNGSVILRNAVAGELRVVGTSKLAFGTDSNTFIRHDGTDLTFEDDADINVKPSVDFLVDAGNAIILDADSGDITFKDEGTSRLAFDLAAAAGEVSISNGTDGDDISFKVNGGTTEIFRLDDSAESLLIAGSKKIEFANGDAYIHHDGTDLKLADDADINLFAGTDILLDAGSLVRVDGALVPHTADGGSLGTVGLEWSDLHLADGGIIKLGNDQEVTLTHVADTGVLLNSDNQLQFGDAGTFVQQSADGVLKASADGATGLDLQLVASNAAGGVFVDAGTGGVHIDSEGRFLAEASGVSSKVELATGGSDNIDLTLSVVGGGDSSLLLSSAGTGSDAIGLNASAGGVDVEASGAVVVESSTSITLGKSGGASEKPVTLNATTFDVNGTGALTMTATSMALDPSQTFDLDAAGAITVDGASVSVGGDGDTGAISLSSNAANVTLATTGSGKVHLNSVGLVDIDASTGASIDAAAGDITLDAAAGSVVVEGAEAASDAVRLHASNAAGGIDIDAGSEGVDVDSTGLVSITSSKNDPKAVEVVASAGGIDILASGAAAGEDIDIVATGSSVNITSTETATDAIVLTANTGAGGVDVLAGSGGFDVESTGQLALSTSQATADAIVIEASDAFGGIDLSAGGSVAVSIDGDSVDIDRDVVITGTTPTLTIGDAGEEDASIIFDGNTVDFHIGLDDSADKLSIGLGTALGTTPNMTLNSADRDVIFAGDIEVQGGKVTLSNGSTIDSETDGELILTEDLVKTSGNLTVLGNLTVQGNTTTVNTETLDVEDVNITLNKGGAAASAAGAGIDFEENEVITGYIRVADDDRSNLDLKAPSGNELKLDVNADVTFTVGAGLTIESASVLNQDLTTDAAVTFASVDADGGVTVDNLTLDGQALSLSAGDFTLDVAGNIVLDADGGSLSFADAGTSLLSVSNSTSDVVIKPAQADKDIIFQEDGGTEIARFDSDAESLLMGASKKIQLGAAEEAIYGDGTDIHFEVGAGGDINLPTNIGLTFGQDSEKIEGDGTFLTISSGSDLVLSSLGAVRISGSVLEFGDTDSGEQISTDGTDLILTSDADIQLSATAAVVVPSGVGLEFGGADSGESISGDGTDLTVVSGGNIILSATDAVVPGGDSADDLGADGTAWRKLYVDDIDLNGQGRIDLDLDGDTSIRASADDVISFEVGGVDKLHLNATELYPEANDGLSLGATANSFADLYLADAGAVRFQDNLSAADVTLTHVRDAGLALKNLNTTDAGGAVLTLQTGDTDIAANDILGAIEFQAPDEGTGTDANEVAAAIAAVSEGDFAADSNATKLSFRTGASEAATEKMSLSSAGVLTLGSAGLVIPDNSTIGSASDTDAITINASGDIAISSTTVSTSSTTGALKVAGGLGVADDLYVGGDLAVTGGTFISSTQVKGADFQVQTAAGAPRVTLSSSGNITGDGSLTMKGSCNLGDSTNDTTSISGNAIIAGSLLTQKISSGGTAILAAGQYIYLVTSDSQTITLPNATGLEGIRFVVKHTATHGGGGAGTTIATNDDGTIDGSDTITLGTRYAFVEVLCDGSDWHIIAQGGTVTLN